MKATRKVAAVLTAILILLASWSCSKTEIADDSRDSFVGTWEGYMVVENKTLGTYDSSAAMRTIVEWPEDNFLLISWFDAPSVSGKAKIDSFSYGNGMKYFYPAGVTVASPNSSGQSIHQFIGRGRLSLDRTILYETSTRELVHTNAGMDTIYSEETNFGMKTEFTWRARFTRVK